MSASSKLAKEIDGQDDPERLKSACDELLVLLENGFKFSPVAQLVDINNISIGETTLFDVGVELMARLEKNGLGGLFRVVESALKFSRFGRN